MMARSARGAGGALCHTTYLSSRGVGMYLVYGPCNAYGTEQATPDMIWSMLLLLLAEA